MFTPSFNMHSQYGPAVARSATWKPVEGIIGHHVWWMTHLPHGSGVTDGFYNNWWQYIVNYDQAIKDLPPPGASFQKAKIAMYAPD